MISFTGFSSQPSVITGPPTQKGEVTVLSYVLNNKLIQRKSLKTSTQDVLQLPFVPSILLVIGAWLHRCPRRARLKAPDGRASRPRSTTIKQGYIRFLYKREPWGGGTCL